MSDKQQPFKMPEPDIDDLMRQAGLDAISDKDYRASQGQQMTAPEQDRYDALVYFAELVRAAPSPGMPSDKALQEAGYTLLSDLASIDTYECNLRDQPEAYAALDRYLAALRSPADQGEKDRKDAERYRWLARKVSGHGVIDGWAFGFPSHLTLPAPPLAMRDPETALGEAIDAAIDSTKVAAPMSPEGEGETS